jgi:alpha-galactosidase
MLRAGETGYAFATDAGGRLHQLGFGPDSTSAAPSFPVELYPLAYPTFGEDPFAFPALRVTNASGVLSTRLVVDGHETTPHDGGESLRITLVDRDQPLEVVLALRGWDGDGVIEQWAEVTNRQDAPITLHEVAAAAPALGGGDPRLDHYAGGWATEFTPVHDHLTTGVKLIEARATTRPNDEAAPYVRFSPDGPADETTGTVLAAALAWGGNFRIAFERNRMGHLRAWLGHLATAADHVLEPGATFTTPTVTWAWSSAGTRPLTHRLHRWTRAHALRDGDRPRAIVSNNWEATGFRFDQARLARFCAETAEVGAELFLLDDGWFGDEFPRDDDEAGLGDWVVDRRKLPDGLEAVGRAAAGAGVRFGVWIEPEMVNPASALYRDHPDWVVAEPGRERRLERFQLQLDLCRPEVQRHVASVIDGVLGIDAGVSYLKWDANRMVTEPGSNALPADRQSDWPVDVVHATWQAMAGAAERWPDAELMLCASGGGRIDLGTLRHFHEVWLSDNTDPVDRVRMQWHASTFLPVKALAAHVTLWGMRPMPFACAVAMSARFGFDLNRDLLSDDDWAVCRRASATYRRLREVIQHGDLYRLVSPDEGPRAALAYLHPARDHGVVFAYRLPTDDESAAEPSHVERLLLAGLHDDATYRVTAIDLTSDEPGIAYEATGRALASEGLAWSDDGPCTAGIWELEVVSGTA